MTVLMSWGIAAKICAHMVQNEMWMAPGTEKLTLL